MSSTEKTTQSIYWDGPSLKRSVQSRLDAAHWSAEEEFGSFLGYVNYRYIDDDGKQTPAWAADQIQIIAHYVSTGERLDTLREVVRQVPGCVEATCIQAGDVLTGPRPHVRALFDREAHR